MKKLVIIFLLSFAGLSAQNKYEIKVQVKGLKDTVCYLFKYKWESQSIVDTARVKNGRFTFTGKEPLEKGIYFLVKQNLVMLGLDFLVDSAQKFSLSTDTTALYDHLKVSNSKLNEDFREFVLFMSKHNKEMLLYEKELKLRQDKDSVELLTKERVKHFEAVKHYQENYLAQSSNNYLSEIIRLQNEAPKAKEIPLADNGRKDSIWEYYYYVQSYWNNISLKDVGILNTNKLYYHKLKNYFEKVVIQNPDSLIKTCDWLMKQTEGCEELHKYMGFYLTYTVDRSKVIGHDAVFVDLVNKYYKTGKANWYSEEQNKKIVERGEILEPLLMGKTMPEMNVLDTSGSKLIHSLGMDTAKTSEALTSLYYRNQTVLQNKFVGLNKVKADYTIVIFWDVDCGHCQKEVPKLKEVYDKMRNEGKNVEVFAVYVHQDVTKWKKFIREKKLNWINVYDGVHLYDFKKRYDIYSYPVIYLLDKNKTILTKRIGAEVVEDAIDHFNKNQ